MVLKKLIVNLVLQTLLHMERQRQVIKNLLPTLRIVDTHGMEQSFLVADDVVIDEMVLHFGQPYIFGFNLQLIIEIFIAAQESLIGPLLEGLRFLHVPPPFLLVLSGDVL